MTGLHDMDKFVQAQLILAALTIVVHMHPAHGLFLASVCAVTGLHNMDEFVQAQLILAALTIIARVSGCQQHSPHLFYPHALFLIWLVCAQ